MTKELKMAMLKPLVERVFELSKHYEDVYLNWNDEARINYILEEL